MATESRDLEEIKRWLKRLEQLDGTPIRTSDGVFLCVEPKIKRPVELIDEIKRTSALSSSTLEKHMSARSSLLVQPRFLATAQRDIRRFELKPAAFELISEARRIFKN